MKGWGLQTTEPLKAGQFAAEYVGELIDNQMVRERIQTERDRIAKKKARSPNSTDIEAFYFMTIMDDMVIDAGRKAGFARFTNHSCNPNCDVVKWHIGSGDSTDIRCGIFANRSIPAGTELTIDYKYDRIGNLERQPCYCGELSCAKFIGGEKRELSTCRAVPPRTGTGPWNVLLIVLLLGWSVCVCVISGWCICEEETR